MSNGKGITKYDLLNLFKKIWLRNDIEILPFDGNGVDKSIAKSEKFLYEVPEYEEMLLEQYEWMKSHSHLYYNIRAFYDKEKESINHR